ncbi:MAG: hypothetical protein AAF602_06205 [Myxococcota bacterium]
MLVGLWVAIASAAPCEAPFGLDAVLDDVSIIEQALEEGRDVTAARTGVHLRNGLECLDAPLPEVIAGRALRAIGTGIARGGAIDADGWMRTAALLAPDHVFPEGHVSAPAWTVAVRASARYPFESLSAHQLAPGAHYLDGRPLTEAGAEAGLPHLYQYQPLDGPVQNYLIEGTGFPELTLSAPAPPPPEPPVDPLFDDPPVALERRRWSAERVALVSGGLTALAGAGALLAWSTQTEARFREATTEADIERYRDATNRLVIGATASAGFGVVALALGAFANGSGQPVTPTVTVRF